jgi:HTH-type transcriptional regulator/antitoxin HigA
MTGIIPQGRQRMPDWSVHPGVILREHLDARGISEAAFAEQAELSPRLVSSVLSGRRKISMRTAKRIERVLGMESCIWDFIQARFNLFQVGQAATMMSPAE